MKNKIRQLTGKPYLVFKNSEIYQSLKAVAFIRSLKISSGQLLWKYFPHNPELHDDPALQIVFKLIIKELKPTCFVETGTFLGSSTRYIAKHFPHLKIFTCEINRTNYLKAKENLAKYPNVTVIHDNSPDFLRKITKSDKLGSRPLFFLDAHWLDQWPLEEEVKIIGNNLKEAIIIIDDFKIPGEPQFNFDKYADKECSMEMVNPNLNRKKKYGLLMPKYKISDLIKLAKSNIYMVGYPIIFQELDAEFNKFAAHPFVDKYFQNRNSLLKS